MKKTCKCMAILLVLTLVVSLTSCGSESGATGFTESGSASANAAADNEGGGSGEGGRSITLITSEKAYDGMADAYQAAAEAFKELTGNTLNIQFQGQWTDLIQTLQAAKISGESYDMTSVGSGNLHQSIAVSGLVMDITEIVEPIKDRFVGDSLSHHTIGGRVFGIPHGAVSTMGLYYNKTMLDELGLSLNSGYTYDDLVNICNTISTEKGITPILQQGASWWWWPAWFFATFAQETGNTSEAEIEKWLRGERSLVEDDAIAAFNDIAKFFNDGLLDQTSLETDNEAMAAAFLQQKCAMFFGSSGEYPKCEGADFEIGFVSYPVMVPGAIAQSSGGADEGLNILTLANPDNIDICAQVLEYFTRPEVAAPMFQPSKNFGYSIAGVDGFETQVSSEQWNLFQNQTIMYLDWYWSAEHNDAFVAAIQGVVGGQMTGEEAAKYVQDAYDSTVSNEGYVYDWWNSWTEDDWAAVAPPYIPAINVG